MAEKLFMMPHTVPNRPTKGDTEPMVASMPSCFSIPSISRRMVTLIAFSIRSLIPASMDSRKPLVLSKPRRHSRNPAMNMAARGWSLRAANC